MGVRTVIVLKKNFEEKKKKVDLIHKTQISILHGKCGLSNGMCLNTIESIIGNGEQCRIEAFSPFPTMFLKAFFIEAFKNRDYEVV